jgi:uncharacterized SAM-binding protein YcdF (DUF218 family)
VKRALLRAAVVAALLAVIAAVSVPRLGRWLVAEDALVRADVIFVLGGTYLERPLEAVDLYHEGWAPAILLSREVVDYGEATLRARGLDVPNAADLQQQIMTQLGVLASAIEVLRPEQGSTADESDALLSAARGHGWHRAIVVTSKQHTRRAGVAMRRKLAGTGVTVILRASRYDRSDVDHWWRHRQTLRFTLFEWQRLVAYWAGIGD